MTQNVILFFRILLEADPNAVVQKVAIRNEDIPLGEQTVAQVVLTRHDINIQVFWSWKHL